MNVDAQTSKKIQELQIVEQAMQTSLMQKQSFQMECNEGMNALKEIKETKDEVYRILGGIMLKADKQILIKELEEKKKMLELKIQALEKQEKHLEEKLESLRKEISTAVSSDKK